MLVSCPAVNADGSLARIDNWQEMTDKEQKATMRILGKRNRQRLAELRGSTGDEQGA